MQHPATQTASATHAQPTVAGPAVVLAIAPTNYPPVGSCRVWIPNAPTGEQQAPCDCFSLILDVPLGAWVLYRPSSDESVLQVSQYDSSRPNVIKSVDLYDAKTGKFLRNVRHTG